MTILYILCLRCLLNPYNNMQWQLNEDYRIQSPRINTKQMARTKGNQTTEHSKKLIPGYTANFWLNTVSHPAPLNLQSACELAVPVNMLSTAPGILCLIQAFSIPGRFLQLASSCHSCLASVRLLLSTPLGLTLLYFTLEVRAPPQ